MPLKINVQIDIVVYSILAGILIGILFDFYKIIRGIKVPKIVVVIEDLLFWILTALFIFVFLLFNNYAFLGPYVYIFMIITLLLYIKFISPIILHIERRFISIFISIFRVIFKNIIYPIKIIYYNISGKR
ncbi:spore cortex biosynthesis protein YabQ [Clostridium sp.]|uniref:spore cortex biosynthesis protein YabQ n=1 Tax=Clostridium sp. TaxID=1506 RepID=UPI00262A4C68|nr:spore cortex biosynthesis protein YabQ [Clostridium sp.]